MKITTNLGIRLGSVVRDLITGEEAVATCIGVAATGAWHVVCKPRTVDKDGRQKTSFNCAEQCLAIVSNPILLEPEFDEFPEFEMFSMVRRKIGQQTGQIRHVDYHVTGCVRYQVTTGQVDDRGEVVILYCDADELEMLPERQQLPHPDNSTPRSPGEPCRPERPKWQ